MKGLFFALIVFGCHCAAAQEAVLPHRRAKGVYVEAFGMSGFGLSLNYDSRLKKGRIDGWGFRAGTGYSAAPDDGRRMQSYYFPVMLNHIVGKRRVAFESGLGMTLIISRWRYDVGTYTGRPGREQSFEKRLYGNFGLRLQPLKKGLLFRLYWSPAMQPEGKIIPYYFGTSLGFGFR